MEDKRVSLKQVVAIGGAFMGFVIGSSFASGQECMQYFTGFGVWKSVGAGLIALLLYVWFVSTIVEDGRYLKLNNSGKIFNFYLGKYAGLVIFAGMLYTKYIKKRKYEDFDENDVLLKKKSA